MWLWLWLPAGLLAAPVVPGRARRRRQQRWLRLLHVPLSRWAADGQLLCPPGRLVLAAGHAMGHALICSAATISNTCVIGGRHRVGLVITKHEGPGCATARPR